jgi:hypothetical protein
MASVASMIFGEKQKPDPSMQAAQQKAADDAAKREAELKAQQDARERALARGGRQQLIGPGGELGVPDGGAEAGTKTKLGA